MMADQSYQDILVDVLRTGVITSSDVESLSSIEEVPDETEVNDYKLIELSPLFLAMEDEPDQLERKLHGMAHEAIAEGDINKAWMIILAFNNE